MNQYVVHWGNLASSKKIVHAITKYELEDKYCATDIRRNAVIFEAWPWPKRQRHYYRLLAGLIAPINRVLIDQASKQLL